MQRRVFITGVAVAWLQAGMALAAGYQDDVVAQLRNQGFSRIEVTTTWLGRSRITAQKGKVSREIVLNPRTGEILRDLVQSGDSKVSPRIGESGGGEHSSSSGGGDDGARDATDDHGGSGNSGSGSSGSGSGSSGESGSGEGKDGGKDAHEGQDD